MITAVPEIKIAIPESLCRPIMLFELLVIKPLSKESVLGG